MEAQLKLYDIIFSFAKPMALKAAILLNIPAILATSKEPLSVPEIASHISSSTGKSPNLDYLARILTFLSSHGVFAQTIYTEQGDVKIQKYGVTSISELLVESSNSNKSSAALLLMESNGVFMEAWHHLYESTTMGGSPFERAHDGMSVWEYAKIHPSFSKLVNDGMASNSEIVMKLVLESYEGFKEMRSVVDVGGGVGSAISMIVQKYTHIRGINYDLPHVVATAHRNNILGVEHVGGDMFENVPSAHGVFLKWVLHDWSDEECIRLLKNCYRATPEHGKVIIIDIVVEEEGPLRSLELTLDMFIMAHTRRGKERTEEEYKMLCQAAGFKCYNIIKLPFIQLIIEFTKS